MHKGWSSCRPPPPLEIAPVHLGLKPGLRLETVIGDPVILFLDRTDKELRGVVSARVAQPADTLQDPCRPIVVLGKKIPDDLMIWLQNGRLALLAAICRKGAALKILLTVSRWIPSFLEISRTL